MLDHGARRCRLTDEFRVDVHGWVHKIADTRITDVRGRVHEGRHFKG